MDAVGVPLLIACVCVCEYTLMTQSISISGAICCECMREYCNNNCSVYRCMHPNGKWYVCSPPVHFKMDYVTYSLTLLSIAALNVKAIMS